MILTETDAIGRLREINVPIHGHFEYASGLHGDTYVNKQTIYQNAALTSDLCETIARWCVDTRIQVVVAPPSGGKVLAEVIARHLSLMLKRPVSSVCLVKTPNNNLIMQRADVFKVEGKRVLVADDVITTGGSMKRALTVTRGVGGRILAAASIWNRGGITLDDLNAAVQGMNVRKFFSVVTQKFNLWAAPCQLCDRKVPIDKKFGHGKYS